MKLPTYFRVLISLGCLLLTSCGTETSVKNALPDSVIQSAKIHINQVALERLGPKSAIVELPRGSLLRNVTVVNNAGKHVVTAQVRESDTFSEWAEEKSYFHVDFSQLTTSGNYRLKIVGTSGESIETSNFLVSNNALFMSTMPSALSYINKNRHTSERDRSIPVIDTGELVDVYGGWKDAGGDTGKYLSHLSHSNFFTPQQASFVVWSLLSTYSNAEANLSKLGISDSWIKEAFWGTDYLHRVLSKEGFFYATVFDKWGYDPKRYITGYKGIHGEYTPNYQSAFREGGGFAIAALAKASKLAKDVGISGEFSAKDYLADAQRAFEHLKHNNLSYCNDGKENIIDEYTSLVAAIELFKATGENDYLSYARKRVEQILARHTSKGWFETGEGTRPYFHAVEAGLPVISLLLYRQIETDTLRKQKALDTAIAAMKHQLTLDSQVANPFNYPRQNFRTYDHEKKEYTSDVLSGFFIPHENETGYWWQGESARLASISTAAHLTTMAIAQSSGGKDKALIASLKRLTQNNLDWIMGRNPYDLCMMYGFGDKNPSYSRSGGSMVKGGISNGLTGKMDDPEGRGIDWMAGTSNTNWRWVEQWTPHSAWFIYTLGVQAKN